MGIPVYNPRGRANVVWRVLFCNIICCVLLLSAMPLFADGNMGDTICPFVKIEPERLPDMTIPRGGHSIFYVNGELTVAGGHTTNFVPTPTAEYFDGKAWHLMTMAYSHDNGFAVVLNSGEVIIGGGHDEPLGVGQTFMLERYTPTTHKFEGFGCLDRRRTLANATLLENGRVIIAGNHYAPDAIGCYDGSSQVQHVKDVRQGRANPYIFPTANDNAIIIGGYGIHADTLRTVWADRLKGEAFRVPLLEEWKLEYSDHPFNSNACAIDKYAYLMTASGQNGEFGFVVIRDTCFSVLPTACPVPKRGPFGPIFYKHIIAVDKNRHRGYVVGVDDSLYNRQYVLAVNYAQRPAKLTLYYTDTLEHATSTVPVVTPDGDLILAGGIPRNNYKPFAAVWRYHFTTDMPAATDRMSYVMILLIALGGIAVLGGVFVFLRRNRSRKLESVQVIEDISNVITDDAGNDNNPSTDNKVAELMELICQLMDKEQLYLRSDLRLQDVAVHLNTNSTYVSESINSVRGMSFSQFVNTYRVRHAQELLRQQPDMKTANVATESGFSTEASFFRNFKAIVGMTPREWLNNSQKD